MSVKFLKIKTNGEKSTMNKISKLWTKTVCHCLFDVPPCVTVQWGLSIPLGGLTRLDAGLTADWATEAFYIVLFLNSSPFINFLHLVHNTRGYFEKYIYFAHENKFWKGHTLFFYCFKPQYGSTGCCHLAKEADGSLTKPADQWGRKR